ncbi:MAG: orotidine-5'-phosphate decarboxylase [Chloroflexia bacterium]
MKTFLNKLRSSIVRTNGLLCVGLDPDPARIPPEYGRGADAAFQYNRMVVEATADLACAYKPNLAFYERYGAEGIRALERTLSVIPAHTPTIADAKRGDIANTSEAYAEALFGALGFDSATVSPYLGLEALRPFLDWEGKGVWILCRTSNPESTEFQSILANGEHGVEPLFLHVARAVARLDSRAVAGLVVGATACGDVQRVRAVAPDAPLLIPGVGLQGGGLEEAVGVHGQAPALINASRSILFPAGGEPTPARVRAAAQTVHAQISDLLAVKASA